MRKYQLIQILLILVPCVSCCQGKQGSSANQQNNIEVSTIFGGPEQVGVLETGLITEASGIVVNSKIEKTIWVHNDSGNDPFLFLIDQNANIRKRFYLAGIENRDWEDITLGPGPESDKPYIYLGDIGDNLRIRDQKTIYRFPEPDVSADGHDHTDTIRNIETFKIAYPDGNHDAEALMIDPISQDLFIISKDVKSPSVYRLPADSLTNSDHGNPIVLEHCGQVEISEDSMLGLITAGDIAADGNEVLIKTYTKIYYWKKEDPEISICELLRSTPATLTYEPEPQGESIAFSPNRDGYYTLSEKRFGSTPILLFYPRK